MVGPSLEEVFPGLRGQPYQITSPRDRKYNCIAFAAGDNRNWWWPGDAEEDTRPAGAARVDPSAPVLIGGTIMDTVVRDS